MLLLSPTTSGGTRWGIIPFLVRRIKPPVPEPVAAHIAYLVSEFAVKVGIVAIPLVGALALSGVVSEVDSTAVAVLVPLDSGLGSRGGSTISIGTISTGIGIGCASGCRRVVSELSDFIGEGCNRFLVLVEVRGLGHIGRDN
jgi:hypothetical protein